MAAGIRHDAWSDFELTLLQGVVNDLDWFEQVAHLIGRSDGAIRCKMSALRKEAGIIPGPFGAKSKSTASIEWERALDGSEKLRRAIREMADA